MKEDGIEIENNKKYYMKNKHRIYQNKKLEIEVEFI